MAEIFVSPGVYVRERDFSYYVSSIGDSALALVGETQKGPAMRPTLITNMSDFREIFGNPHPQKHVGYCAKSYFKYSNRAYIVRVLGDDTLRESWNLVSINNTSGTSLATLLVSGSPSVTLIHGVDTGAVAADENFFMVISGGAGEVIYSGNINLKDQNSPVYIETKFPRNTNITETTIALQHVFPLRTVGVEVDSGTTTTGITTSGPANVTTYKSAKSPMIVGDIADSLTAGVSLFTVNSIGDGNSSNSDVKVTIENIDTTNVTFDLTVRKFSDTNASQIFYETFPKLSMDPTNLNFVARAIGDSIDETGDYALISKYIYITVEPDVPAGALPWGFNRITSLSGNGLVFAQWPMTTGFTDTTSIKRQYLGVDFESIDPDHLMGGWSSAWDIAKSSSNYIKGFHMNSGASETYYNIGPSATTTYSKSYAKFIVPLIGGNDGWSWTGVTRGLLGATPTTSESTQWKAALDTLRSTEDIDINLLAVPGVGISNSIGTYAIELVEERADAFYIGDLTSGSTTPAGIVSTISSIDSNYAATYWPYVKIYDSDNTQDVTLPPTAQALEAIAYTDQISYPWFAPAGLNRGLLTDVIRAKYKLTQDDRETLYENKINPVATFAGQGIAIWGQKTLQTRTTALDRINVRRMMLYIEKVIAGAALYLDFEQNDETTWDRFKGMVQPILDTVKINRGLTDFRVIMDETTNTPDMIERGQMVGQIYIKPTKTAEVILINFNLMAQGATFEE